MTIFRSKYNQLSASSYDEVLNSARKEFNRLRANTKRQPYIKSKHFNGDKIFITVFWDHLMQKHLRKRTERLKLYPAAIDLLRNYTRKPEIIVETTHKDVYLYRFYGKTKDGIEFCVQVKENKRTKRRDFMSVFKRKIPN